MLQSTNYITLLAYLASSRDGWVDMTVYTVLGRYGALFDDTRLLS